jgi:hypothetical protein
MNKSIPLCLILFVLLITVSGCNSVSEEQILKSKGIKYDQIIHNETVQDGIISFYSTSYKNNIPGLGLALLQGNPEKGWKLIYHEDNSYSSDSMITWDIFKTSSVINGKPYRIVYGLINNSDIDKVIVTNDHENYEINPDVEAKIVQKNDKRIWFKKLEKNVNIETLFIVGLSKGENVFIWEFK